MSLALAADAGLWNVTWLANESIFRAYEDDSVPMSLKPLVMSIGLRHLMDLAQSRIDGKTLQSLAAVLRAAEVIKAIDEAQDLKPGISEAKWKAWLRFARKRARLSHDMKCEALVFQDPEQLSVAAREDIEFQKKLPEPALPTFHKLGPEEQIKFIEWLDGLKRGTVQ